MATIPSAQECSLLGCDPPPIALACLVGVSKEMAIADGKLVTLGAPTAIDGVRESR